MKMRRPHQLNVPLPLLIGFGREPVIEQDTEQAPVLHFLVAGISEDKFGQPILLLDY